jgi:hypothetical protein
MVVTAILAGQSARAQQPGGLDPSRRPAVSPYVNLLRTGSSPAINYYGIVRPEIMFGNALNQLQSQQATLANQQQDQAAAIALPATGHRSGFMTQGKYFMSSGGQTSATTFAKAAGISPPKSGGRP